MGWIETVALIGALFFLIKFISDSKFVKRQNEKAIRDANKWAKKNKKYIIRKNKIVDKYVDRPLDKYVATPISFIFKALFIIAGVILLIYILSAAAGGLKSLYYGSPFLFLFLIWLLFFRPRN
jgi:ABC-type multidrug transport system fused ATPase/permease subunit